MLHRLTALATILLLTACQGQMAEPVMEPMFEAAPVAEEPVMAEPTVTDCAPGDDDGIGGTGCQID